MQITRQADYAVRAVLYLSRLGPNQRAATNQVANDQKIPPSFLAKIISQLSIAGLLHTSRGARGGVALAREAKEITLLDVVEAIDGQILLNECVGNNELCVFDSYCPLKPIWCEAQEHLVNRLRETRFDQLVNSHSG
ncbi:MAG: Rrf2 family transcriptional regulator [Anaerolineales bacterium]|nr:Rrf2 family transcriptional regulator [Anaerolineales bacterium]